MLQELRNFLVEKGLEDYITKLRMLREFLIKMRRKYLIISIFLFIAMPVEIISMVFFEVGDKKITVNNVYVLVSTFSGFALIITGFLLGMTIMKYLTFRRAVKLIDEFINEIMFKKDIDKVVSISRTFISKLSKELSIPRTYVIKRLIFKRKGVPYVL